MKLRESGMPEEEYWESLFDAELILDRLGIDATVRDVAELGCGYGTFTLPVAGRIRGVIEAYDIEPAMVERTIRRAREAGLDNVRAEVRDVLAEGFGSEPRTKDACLLFNILHGEEPERLLAHAARAVHPGGRVLVIHWRYDPTTPRGPSLEIRPRPEQIIEWARRTNMLRFVAPVVDLPPWHYGLRFTGLQANDRP
ncbi:MAG: class I SAM-dependent methyltransferase [Planctomycetes bacterium]|nr:class I SAM-dependent methyltransferase [Planctomycetota bacterium]